MPSHVADDVAVSEVTAAPAADDDVPEHEPLRCRTNSSPCIPRSQHKSAARRVRSLLPDDLTTHSRSPQWLQATQALLRSLRLRDGERRDGSSTQAEPKQRVTRLSSRLTSHHSSSSEEWYSELQLLTEASEAPTSTKSSRPDVRTIEVEPATASRNKVPDTSGSANDSSPPEQETERRSRCCSHCSVT